MDHQNWKIGTAAPPATLATTVFLAALGILVSNEEPLQLLAQYLVSTFGVVTVGHMIKQLTTTDMREALSKSGLNAAYEQTIGSFLVGPGEAGHEFVKPSKRSRGPDEYKTGGLHEKKFCKDRKPITDELGGESALHKLFEKLGRTFALWCSIPAKPTRLSQPEVNT